MRLYIEGHGRHGFIISREYVDAPPVRIIRGSRARAFVERYNSMFKAKLDEWTDQNVPQHLRG